MLATLEKVVSHTQSDARLTRDSITKITCDRRIYTKGYAIDINIWRVSAWDIPNVIPMENFPLYPMTPSYMYVDVCCYDNNYSRNFRFCPHLDQRYQITKRQHWPWSPSRRWLDRTLDRDGYGAGSTANKPNPNRPHHNPFPYISLCHHQTSAPSYYQSGR